MHPALWWSRPLLVLRTALLALLVCGLVSGLYARGPTKAPAVVGEIAVADLPPQAREVLALIRQGGPFRYKKDGTTFQNREKRLPVRARGDYAEYTVRTPGSRDRGARRIVAGRGSNGSFATSDEYYYTDDHYETFRRIRE
jgi:ribonuclease T1